MTEAIYVIDGKEYSFSIRENLELKSGYLYLNDKKVFDTFRRGSNIINNIVTFNDVDITDYGREIFNIPEEFNNHFVRVSIRV